MRATRAHESFRSHDGVGTGGPFAPASSIASISSDMRSAKKAEKSGVEDYDQGMNGDRG